MTVPDGTCGVHPSTIPFALTVAQVLPPAFNPSDVDTNTLFCKVLSDTFRFLTPFSRLLLLLVAGSSEHRSLQHLRHLQQTQWDSLHKDNTRNMTKHSPKKNIQLIVTTGTFW